jgi:succinyl-CoA synthetase beta subunit
VLLVNLVSSLIPSDKIAAVIAGYLKRRIRKPRGVSEIRPDTLITHTVRVPHLVVRIAGSSCDRTRSLLESGQVSLVENLDDAVSQTILLAKPLSKPSKP